MGSGRSKGPWFVPILRRLDSRNVPMDTRVIYTESHRSHRLSYILPGGVKSLCQIEKKLDVGDPSPPRDHDRL